MKNRLTKARSLAVSVLTLAALGACGSALAQHRGDNHSGGGGGHASSQGGGGGGHASSPGGGGGGSSGGHASLGGPAPAMHGGVGYRGPVTAHRGFPPGGPAPASHGFNGGYSAPAAHGVVGGYSGSRAPSNHRIYSPVYGRGNSGHPGGGYGYHGWGYGYGYGYGYGDGYGYGYGWGTPYYSFVSVLPWYVGTSWWNGVPYYYADNTYYTYNDGAGQYQVVPPPGNAEAADANANAANASAANSPDPYVYPNSGQSPEQQQTDRYECHRWAVDQTGFDPTRADGSAGGNPSGASVDAYRRAEGACLEGRGYTVR